MSLVMRDSDEPFAISVDGLHVVAGYGDHPNWTPEGWARFSDSVVRLVIVRSADNVGDILDVERTMATPEQCPGWADRFDRPHRRRPTIYCDRSTIDAVRREMGERKFDWWAATLDGTTDVPGAVAVQHCGAADSLDPCRTAGHYDESVILDPSWIGQAAPFLTTSSHAGGESSMVIISAPAAINPGRLDVFVIDSNRNVARTFSDGGAGGIDQLDHAWMGVDAEHTPAGGFRPGSLTVSWDNLNRQVVGVEDTHGGAFMAVINPNGSFAQGWTKLRVDVSTP
jgi:hypothetical protein